jgi:hypothetical protein
MFKVYQDESGNQGLMLSEIAKKLREEQQDFFSYYDIDLAVIHSDEKPDLKARVERICIFCNKREPEVTFKNDAHTIPQFTTNRNLISDIECDACNSLFSKYETQLSYFLGISRTLSLLKGQAGIPKYKSPDKTLEVGFKEGEMKIISEGLDNDHWEIDEENKKMKIFAVKHPYNPIEAFKSFLKMGLCYIDQEELIHFTTTFTILRTSEHDILMKNNPMFRVYKHVLPAPPVPMPVILRMKRKENPKEENCPKYCFVIYFGKYVFQFFMPHYLPDKDIIVDKYKGKLILPFCPPFLNQKHVDIHGTPQRGVFDLSSNEFVRNQKQVISMTFDNISYAESGGTVN